MNDITVVVPSIPPRSSMLTRALSSITAQTLQPAAVVVEIDHDRQGAAVTRTRGLNKVTTDWVAFLDDDDEFSRIHLAALRTAAEESGADYVYSYYLVKDPAGRERPDIDPLNNLGQPFNPDDPVQTTIVTLVRTKLAQEVGFHNPPHDERLIHGQKVGEDFRFTEGCIARGARIVHLPRRTWFWHHHGRNTSGMPNQW